MPEDHQFKCPLLQIWLKGPVRGALLENPQVRRLGDRTFICGQLVFKDDTTDARAGLTALVPIEDVAILTEFPNKSLVNKSAAEWERHKRDRTLASKS